MEKLESRWQSRCFRGINGYMLVINKKACIFMRPYHGRGGQLTRITCQFMGENRKVLYEDTYLPNNLEGHTDEEKIANAGKIASEDALTYMYRKAIEFRNSAADLKKILESN